MDFVERLFNVSPDGGDGTFELGLTLVAIAAVTILYQLFRRLSRRSYSD
jgi:hypothetical protein